MRLTGIRLPGGDLVNPEVHHAFCFLRRYRGAAAGFRPGGHGGQLHELVANAGGCRAG